MNTIIGSLLVIICLSNATHQRWKRQVTDLYAKSGEQCPKVAPGEYSEVSCDTGGPGHPEISFWFNGHSIVSYEAGTDGEVSDSRSAKTTARLTFSTYEETTVTCKAKSKGNEVTASIDISLDGVPPDSVPYQTKFQLAAGNEAPRIVYYDTWYFEKVNYDALLPCRVLSGGTTQREWKDKNNNIIYNSNKFVQTDDGDLLIKYLEIEDRGIYSCEVSNEHGSDKITTNLRVRIN